MKNEKQQIPYHLFKGMLRLVTTDLERRFFQFNSEYKIFSDSGWSTEAKSRGLFVDLSRVRWVELGAAAQLVLLIESAKKEGLKILIALPLNKLSKGESEFLARIKQSSESEYYEKVAIFEGMKLAREYAKNYLTNIQFQRVVVCPHIMVGEVFFSEEYHFESDNSNDTEVEIGKNSTVEILNKIKRPEEIGYKFLIPLIWINAKHHNSSLDFIEEKFTEVLSQPERGLDSIDAQAIKNVIINELLKNVREHSKCDVALLGVALQPSRILSPKDYLLCERNFIEWTTKANTNYISIYFGDTGEGLCKILKSAFIASNLNSKLTEYNIIKWSFDKWSTSKTDEILRGTKGLYRILRIINKYNGLITVRTGNENAGFQKGGQESSKFIHQIVENKKDQNIGLLPGTFLKMQFSPFKELTKFNITPYVSEYEQEEDYKWITKTIKLDSTEPKDIYKGDLTTRNIFREQRTNVLILVDSKNSKLEKPEDIEEAIKNHLLHLSEARHPNGVVVYGFPTGWENIESIVNSVNSLIQEKRLKPDIDSEAVHPDKEDIYDPVLVLGENRQFCWVGDDSNIISCLNELYRSEQPKGKITELDSFNSLEQKAQTRVLQYFMSDDALVSLEYDQALRFNFSNLKTHFSEKLTQRLDELMNKQKDEGKYYITHNLRNVKHWINIDNLIKNDLKGYAFALSASLKEIDKTLPDNLNAYKILIDNQDSFQLAVEFAGWLGIPTKNIINFNDEVDGRLPRRNPIFEEKDDVIILTTIISTKETAQRSLKAVLRDLANPIAVLGIINQSNDEPISVWGKVMSTISLVNKVNYEVSQKEISQLKLKPIYKSPFGYNDEIIETNSNRIDSKEVENIYELIAEQKALHFSHLGKTNSRHFTFYLSPTRLLNDEEKSEKLIYKKFYKKIKEWLTDINKNTFDVWRPTPDFKLSNPVNKITNNISKHFTNEKNHHTCNSISEIKRASYFGEWNLIKPPEYLKNPSPNVVIVDWGSLTGNTTQQMINLAANEGKENILVCILFSQLQPKEEEFLTNIKMIKGRMKKETTGLFSIPETCEIDSVVSVNFFYRFPLRNYESANCPICEHIHALREFEIKGEHMTDFYLKRRERLKIKDKDKADLPPQDFYANDNIFLDSETILSMFKFRVLLQEALLSTYKRKEIEIYLSKILENIDVEKKNPKSEVYSVLYFLSTEIMWMQKPPLVFLSVRNILSQIAKTIATWQLEMAKEFFFDEPSIIRYKFAAISVLRSSDKNEFIQSIHLIFISSKRGTSYSHSITQNLFYHTYSYLKRQYHTSSEYFDVVLKNLDLLLAEDNLSSKLKNVIIFLRFFAEKRKFEIAIPSDSIMSVFASYKKQIKDNYGLAYKHNNVSDDFVEVKPIDYQEMLKKFHANKEPTENIKSIIENPGFINWLNIVPKRWSDVAGYLNNVVINHLGKLDNIINSKLFSSSDTLFATFIKQMLSEKKLFGVHDDLTLQINEIIFNPAILSNKRFFHNFVNTWTFYYHSFIYINQNSPFLSCPLVKIAEQTPCKLIEAIDKAIEESKRRADSLGIKIDFEKNTISEKNVFFPTNQLKHFLDQVFLYNLFTHHVKGQPIKVGINFNLVGTESLALRIISKGTKPKERNSGGLNKFVTEFAFYGGYLNYEYNISQKQFEIEIKLLIWRDEQ
ncbi:MAG: hypothetical protein WCS69_14615 [Ignavibacteriaceae bacterium]|jgi:hypothetical protein